jgi:hypothetical protein
MISVRYPLERARRIVDLARDRLIDAIQAKANRFYFDNNELSCRMVRRAL